ncbi:MAG: hypothetical protein ACJA08_000517 [Cyclobacteriaceae bacterium]|jgi:hypothetical protein
MPIVKKINKAVNGWFYAWIDFPECNKKSPPKGGLFSNSNGDWLFTLLTIL